MKKLILTLITGLGLLASVPAPAATNSISQNPTTNNLTGALIPVSVPRAGGGYNLMNVVVPELLANTLTNNGSATLSSLIISNSTYSAGLIFNGSPSSSQPYVNDWQGNINIGPGSGGTVSLQNISGANYSDYFGTTSYSILAAPYFGNGKIPGSSQWQMLAAPYVQRITAPATFYSPMYAGSAAGLDDLPMNPNLTSEAMPSPPFIITSWSFATPAQFNLNETNCAKILNNATTNGLLAAITNSGLQPYFHLDGNARWIATNRNASGSLQIDTNYFPSGTNWVNTWKSNGWNLTLTMYMYWTPGTYIYLNQSVNDGILTAGTNSIPAMTPNTVRNDVLKFYDWGMDIRPSDHGTDEGYVVSFSRAIASAIITPPVAVNGRGTAWSEPLAQPFRKRPMSSYFMTSTIGQHSAEIQNSANIINHDGNDYWGHITSGSFSATAMAQFRAVMKYEVPYASKGHWPSFSTLGGDDSAVNIRVTMATAALLNCGIQLCTDTNYTLNTLYPTALPILMNTNVLQVMADSTAKCANLYDYGSTNISAWAKPLKDGSILLGLFNETAATSNLTVNLSAYPFTGGRNYTPFDLFAATNLSDVASSVTIPVESGGCRLLKMIASTNPVLNINYVGVVLLATNLTSTNLVETPFKVRLALNGIYQVDVRANIDGLSATDRPRLWVFATNAVSSGQILTYEGTASKRADADYALETTDNVTFPLAITSSGDTYSAGNGYNRLGLIPNGSGYGPDSQTINCKMSLQVNITNAPAEIRFISNNGNSQTTTNTINAGATIRWLRLQ